MTEPLHAWTGACGNTRPNARCRQVSRYWRCQRQLHTAHCPAGATCHTPPCQPCPLQTAHLCGILTAFARSRLRLVPTSWWPTTTIPPLWGHVRYASACWRAWFPTAQSYLGHVRLMGPPPHHPPLYAAGSIARTRVATHHATRHHAPRITAPYARRHATY